MSIIQKVYERYYFPLFENFFKRRKIAEHYFQALDTQWLPHDQLEQMQVQQLKLLLDHAGRYCPYYKKVFRDTKFVPESLTSLSDILTLPMLTKDIIRDNFQSIVSEQHKHHIWQSSTGGSTGQPLQFAYTKESYEWRFAMSKRGYAWAGAPPGSKQAYIWSIQLGNVGILKQLKERLHHFIDRQIYFNNFDFDEKAMSACLKTLNRYKPDCIISYTYPLYNFARYIEENAGLQFAPKGIICAAEKIYPYQRETIEKVFGTKVFNTYGSREFMLIAAECEKHEGLHVSTENLIVEIIKDDSTPAQEGETGKIVVTDLHNYGMPFIRYEIGDLGVATNKKCSCGRGLPLIADVSGRSVDMLKTPAGKMVTGVFFPHLLKDFPDIQRFQVIQERLDCLVIKLVPDGKIQESTMQQIDMEIRKVMGPSMTINYEVVDDIPLNATGKHRVTISKLTDSHHK